MPTYTALTTLPEETRARSLAVALERMQPEPTGVGVFELEDGSGLWEVGGYFEAAPDTGGLALLSAAFGAGEFLVSELPETDWVAKVRRDLSPVEAGRFLVHGAHDAHRVPPDRIALLIEASMAFGTGHHGTTLGCLRAIDRLASDGFSPANVADLGCGTAVLAMAAARVWDVPVFATDLDPVAVEVAQTNLRANGLAGRIECFVAEGVSHDRLRAAAPLDLVVANILKGPLIALAPDIARVASADSRVILSGILNNQAEEVLAVYRRVGFNPVAQEVIVDWTTLTLAR